MSKRKPFKATFGQHGAKVHVWADPKSGVLWGRIRNKKQSLKHRDEDRAKAWAKDQSERLAAGLASVADPVPTVSKVFALYLTTQTPRKGKSQQQQDKRAAKCWTRVLGATKDLHKLTLGEWQAFIDARASGAIDAAGEPVPADQRRQVGARAVENDCVWLQTVLRWATAWQADDAKYLMRENPARGDAFRKAVPHEQNPRRPVATQDRLDAILEAAPAVHPFLVPLLRVVNGTGRRIRAVLALRFEDVRLAKTAAAPHGAIQWPAETDKRGKAWAAPISADVREALDGMARDAVVAGRRADRGYVFPSPANQAKPMDRWYASRLLRRAERRARVPKLGSLWHAYRRKWGTERKHLPVQDVARAGGWKDTHTLATIYQQADDATVLRAVTEPRVLREA